MLCTRATAMCKSGKFSTILVWHNLQKVNSDSNAVLMNCVIFVTITQPSVFFKVVSIHFDILRLWNSPDQCISCVYATI